MENLTEEFQGSLKKLGVTKNDRLLLAVSGGLDSVVLATLCHLSGIDFAIAHANFQLRGNESIRDEEFVRQLAIEYNKPFLVRRFDTAEYASLEKCSIQVAARNLRYGWFKTLTGKAKEKFQFVVTAHHLDDNIETLLMHFFRGTGIEGLTGMPEKNEYLIRPLLTVPVKKLKEFAVSKKLKWVEDSSNASDDYTRNYFRNQLIPSLTTIFPEVHKNLEGNLYRLSDAAMLYQQAIHQHRKKLLKPMGVEMHIPILLLKKTIPVRTILYEILRDYHFSPAQTTDVIRLMDGANGKYISSASFRIIKNRRWLIIAPLEDSTPAHIIIEQNASTVIFPGGTLRIREIAAGETENTSFPSGTVGLDAGKIQFPLILRKWKAGDYFYPLGMSKKKKLARFFIDEKFSKTAKEKTWVLVADTHIICIIGHRIDNRFSISSSTRRILMIKNEGVLVHS